jgi:hypothetical protein
MLKRARAFTRKARRLCSIVETHTHTHTHYFNKYIHYKPNRTHHTASRHEDTELDDTTISFARLHFLKYPATTLRLYGLVAKHVG